ncbi:MAG: TRAP transporter large permease subunit [Verrucomicrobia bacterium]|nr:TRAP transporter large permease subunit [Verrucomicrobiota bacterium]
MSGSPSRETRTEGQVAAAIAGWRPWVRNGEDVVISLALAALVLLPLSEIVLRRLFQTGLSGAGAFEQHLTLVIGLLGGMLAAREGRLLALSTLTRSLEGRWQALGRGFSGSVGAAVSVFLCVAAVQLVQSERAGGKTLAYGIPVWVIQSVMPLGLGTIAWRLVWRAAAGARGRLLALLVTGGLLGLGFHPPLAPDKLVVPALGILLVAVVLGAPIFVMLGGAALILFWGEDLPIASISLTHYSMVTNPTLPTVPLFTLAGYFLAEGGASHRLVGVFQALLGRLRGGPAIVAVVACAFFTSFTGASGVTILALGGLLMPVLLGAGYPERTTLGLITGSGGLGLLFPPSLPLILYAIVASNQTQTGGVTMEKMFLGGLGPGLLLVAMFAGLGVWLGRKQGPRANACEAVRASRAIWVAKWELLVPVVALVALFGGFATPVEAAAVTALYAFAIETFVYRDFKRVRDIPRVASECGLLVGGVLLILGVALGLTNYLVDAQVPTRAVGWVTAAVKSKFVFLLALNLCLLVVGCMMDMYSAVVVVVPLLVPLGIAYGIDPIHLGIIFLANMELGLLTPTVGLNIFLASYRFNQPVLQVSRAVLPLQGLLLAGVLLITYLPPLTTFLPRWLGK